MLLFRPLLLRFVSLTQTSLLSVPPRGGVASVPDDFADVTEVSEMRSPPLPKALSALRINEGGNINRADILGTVTDLKVCLQPPV
ncbi:expressed protein [Echinococcus multilocularis]|uniref:Expressed protein n=1 Tax=Echinococcus multilocularis TaxID=6211 RepID=A0A068XZ22_ECHMU|nr:expressed protein [Echinococcus multilocularis]